MKKEIPFFENDRIAMSFANRPSKGFTQYAFLGGGKMAEAIFKGMLDSDLATQEDIIVCERNNERLMELVGNYNIIGHNKSESILGSRVIFLAVKPQDIAEAVEGCSFMEDHLLISIAAGLTIAKLREIVGNDVRIVRVMPNLPLAVTEGMCAYCGDEKMLKKDKLLVEKIFSELGAVCEMPEEEFDAVTALSGSGPAFFAWVLKTFAEAAAQAGMAEEVTVPFALQTMFGTAAYLMANETNPDDFIKAVCSKGGTTEAGMAALNVPEVKAALTQTILAAAKRSAELRGE